MNRRTVLGSAGALASVGLAGCVGSLQSSVEGFFESPVPIEIHNEDTQYYNLYLEAVEIESGRQSYDQGFAITPGESVSPEHLSRTDQRLEVTMFGGSQGESFGDGDYEEEAIEAVEEVEVTTETRIVVIRLRDDDLVVDVEQREATNETEAEAETN